MYQEQRLEKILELLEEKESLSSKEMEKFFDVSRDTVRRDFSLLAASGKVKRTHGGILRSEPEKHIVSFNERLEAFTQEKQHIAKKAIDFIQDGGTYFLDVSTITLKLIELITYEVTIYSHSLDNAIMVSAQPNIDFHLLGGKYFPKNRFYYSINEAEILKNISFDAVFIGAAGLKNKDVSYVDQEDAYIKKLVLENAKKKVLLAEQSKFNKTATYSIGKINQFDYFITDSKPSIEKGIIEDSEIKIIY